MVDIVGNLAYISGVQNKPLFRVLYFTYFSLPFFTCYFCTPLYHPSSGKQNVLASASNKSPHFPHEFPVLALRDFSFSFSSSSFFCCSRVTRGTVTSSPALISKGLQSPPTK